MAGFLLIGVPSAMPGSSFAGHVHDAIEFRQPDPAVAEWPPVIGAVMLAVGYQIFMGWVDEGEEGATAESGQTEATAWASNGGG